MKTIDMLDVMSRTALEFIGQGGLGYSFDVLDDGKKSPYTESVRNLLYVPALIRLLFTRFV